MIKVSFWKIFHEVASASIASFDSSLFGLFQTPHVCSTPSVEVVILPSSFSLSFPFLFYSLVHLHFFLFSCFLMLSSPMYNPKVICIRALKDRAHSMSYVNATRRLIDLVKGMGIRELGIWMVIILKKECLERMLSLLQPSIDSWQIWTCFTFTKQYTYKASMFTSFNKWRFWSWKQR